MDGGGSARECYLMGGPAFAGIGGGVRLKLSPTTGLLLGPILPARQGTRTGMRLGTPLYMAPEQIRSSRDVDRRADLWSLGVIAFKCATGVLPFDGQSLGDLLVKICTSPVPVPSQIAPGLPPAFDAWFAKALDREPALRFSSANELADALAFAAGLSVKRGPNSLSNPQSAPAGGAVAAARTGDPSGGAMGAAPNITPMNASTPQFAGTSAPFTATSPGATKRSNAGVVIGMAVGMLVLGAGGVTAYTVLGRRAAPAATGTPSATPAPPPPSALPPTPTVVVGNDTIAPLPTASTPALGAPPNGARGRTRPGPKPTGSTTAALPPPLPKPGGKTDPKTEPEPKPVKTEPKPEPKPAAAQPVRSEPRPTAMAGDDKGTAAAEKGREQIYEGAFRPAAKRHEPWLERCRSQMHGAVAVLDAACAACGPDAWLAGERQTQADITAAVVTTFLVESPATALDVAAYPALAALVARCESQAEFRATYRPWSAPKA